MDLPRFTSTYHHKPYISIDPTRPNLSAKGKVVVVTGGASGIGRATSHAFVIAGVKDLVILDRDSENLHKVKAELNEPFPNSTIHTIAVDITNRDLVEESLRQVVSVVGGLFDVLVSNAAYQPIRTTVVNSSQDDWWYGFDVNVRGSYNVIRSFLEHAKENAVLINVSSCLAHLPDLGKGDLVGQSSYSAAKIATTRIMEILQQERKDLKIINLHPGLIPTKLAAISGNLEVSKDDGKKSIPFWLILPHDDLSNSLAL
jgi:NAD(P)-dependent dehydrogenase (short-subunit alcohol dehydrogenase family)